MFLVLAADVTSMGSAPVIDLARARDALVGGAIAATLGAVVLRALESGPASRVLFVLVPVLAAGAAAAAAARSMRRTDRWLATGLALWAAGDVALRYVGRPELHAPLIIVGTVVIAIALTTRLVMFGAEYRSAALDSVVVGLVATGIVWSLLVRAALDDASRSSADAVFVALSPGATVMLVSLAGNIAIRTRRLVDLLPVVATMCGFTADLVAALGRPSDAWPSALPLQVLWSVQYVGLAIWCGRSTSAGGPLYSPAKRMVTIVAASVVNFTVTPMLRASTEISDRAILGVINVCVITTLMYRVAHVIRDATRAHETRVSLERFRLLAENSTDCVALVDVDGRIVFASDSWERLLGVRVPDLLGSLAADHIHADDLDRATALFGALVASRSTEPVTFEARLRARAEQEERWVEAIVASHLDDPALKGVVMTMRDITERRRQVERLEDLAATDELTGLLNRRAIEAILVRELAGAAEDRLVGVLFFDLDRFKLVNDTFGHGAGDRLLEAVADQLRAAARVGDFLARFGGDEFVVVCPDLPDAQSAVAIGERILGGISTPIRIGGTVTSPSVTIGVSTRGHLPLHRDAHDASAKLLAEADAAMYAGKQRGGHCVQLFTPRLRAESADRLSIETDLRRAVEDGEITVAYQPVVWADGRLASVEALARWDRPGWGPVPPDAFIAIAEDSGLIGQLGLHVIGRALQDLVALDALHPGAVGATTVNVSPVQLQDAAFVDDVLGLVADHGMDHRLAIEVTETTVVKDPDTTFARLQRLRDHGVFVAIDDFGVGHASLASMRQMPADSLKIDRSFVRDMLTDPVATAIVDASLALGRAASMAVIAEGVETEDHADALRGRGVELLQGYAIARPMRFDALVEWIAAMPAPAGATAPIVSGEVLGGGAA
jgi:diguanylate cyclase (GGDEF)-like protein/PAS domain S-box-containing protein